MFPLETFCFRAPSSSPEHCLSFSALLIVILPAGSIEFLKQNAQFVLNSSGYSALEAGFIHDWAPWWISGLTLACFSAWFSSKCGLLCGILFLPILSENVLCVFKPRRPFSLSKTLTVKSGKCSCYSSVSDSLLFKGGDTFSPLRGREIKQNKKKTGSCDHLGDGKEYMARFPIVVLEDEVCSDWKLLSLEPAWIFANIFRMSNSANTVLVKLYLV